ncbi:MAG TPA: ribonuclease Z [Candidatus Nanoarchaeia archaeon]|nr:ribonuclease Z [Candidatus Nanoarchaeia archaeon]
MQITFLGTSSMVPTKDRNHTAVFLSYDTEGILLDCGEGTQRQFKIAGISLQKVTKILISHWHGDHVLGLPGLMQTLSSTDYDKKLQIYGPKETKKRIEKLFEAFVFDKKLDFEVHEISNGKFFENNDYILESYQLEHGVETLGFAFIEKDKRKVDMKKVRKFGVSQGPLVGKLQQGQSIEFKGKKISPDDVTFMEKGKKVSYVTDTVICNGCYKAAKDSDILICESTYSSKLMEKGEEYGHMTSKQAGMLANKSNVGKLVLMHFSARYKDTKELEEDAKDVFDNTVCAWDFMKLEL